MNPDYILIFVLFIVLSPQLLFTLPSFTKGALLGASQANVSVASALTHAVVFIALHHYLGKYIMQSVGLIPETETATPKPFIGVMDLVCGTLFFLLTPGVLLTLPPVAMDFTNSKNVFFTGKTTVPSVVVHAFVFVIAHHYIVKFMNSLGFHEP
jgi:hypothetical protein